VASEGYVIMSNDEDTRTSPQISPFESIRKTSEDGIEYWSARDLAKELGYAEYREFQGVVHMAEVACKNSGQLSSNHFALVCDVVTDDNDASCTIEDVHLSRYACYLVIQNADSSKGSVASGQSDIALQTYRQEQNDRPASEKARDFAIFEDHGYMGLYGGLKAKDIHSRKALKKNQRILDHMGSEELAAVSSVANRSICGGGEWLIPFLFLIFLDPGRSTIGENNEELMKNRYESCQIS
jgi:DNA-damage-inducible protein D